MARSIRVTFTHDEAEELLSTEWPPKDPVTRLRARCKITSALLADRQYVPPLLREPRSRDEA